MPYKIIKKGDVYKLYNIKKKKLISTNFKSKKTAGEMGIRWMNYMGEKGVIRGMSVVEK